MQKYLFCFSLFYFLLSQSLCFAQTPQGYYDMAQEKKSFELKTALHEIASQNFKNWNYADLNKHYQRTDMDLYYEKDSTLLDLYSENTKGADAYEYNFTQNISTASKEGQGWNREHIVPQSTFASLYPMYSDLFFVVPADAYINQRRSNYPYAKVSKANYTFSNGSKIGTSGTSGYSGSVIEPIDEFKGDIARSILYFAVRYQGIIGTMNHNASTNILNGTEEKVFSDWYLQSLLDWHEQDPVSQREIDRNNTIYQIQNNRNPFIDHPEYVSLIWKENRASIAEQNKEIQLLKKSATFLSLTWEKDESTVGYQILVGDKVIATTNQNSYDIGHLSAKTNYQITIKTYDQNGNYFPYARASFTTNEQDSSPGEIFISKVIEGSTYNKAIEISNKTGFAMDLKNYKLKMQSYNSNTQTYYISGSYQLEGILKNNESIFLMHPLQEFEKIPVGEKTWQTAATPLNFNGEQYLDLSYNNSAIDAIGYYGKREPYNQDISLFRKPEITSPSKNFLPEQWDTFAINTTIAPGSLSVQEIKPESFSIAPIPAKHTLNVLGTTSEEIQIFDQEGKMKAKYPKGTATLDLSNLPIGTYILISGSQSRKFIKTGN